MAVRLPVTSGCGRSADPGGVEQVVLGVRRQLGADAGVRHGGAAH